MNPVEVGILEPHKHESRPFLPYESAMAKRAKKTTVFLVIDDDDQRNKLATGLRKTGYDVHDYMTAREFLIDKRHHVGGVVVCEYRLHGMSGAELCERLAAERSDLPTLLMALKIDVPKVLAAGLTEFVVGPVAIESLTEAITRATEGEEFTAAELERAFKKLTEREKEIATMIVAGESSGQIAAKLELSIKTVEAHRARIMFKTRADDVGDLARLWRAWQGMK